MKTLLFFYLISHSITSLGQCDTSFYSFKREIIAKVSNKINQNFKMESLSSTAKLEFSDYQKFTYTISDSKSTIGFVCIRNGVCNNYIDSLCIKNTQEKNSYYFDKTFLENFMSSDDYKLCDSVNYSHTMALVIENPIGGWHKLENFYFRFIDNKDLNTFYKGQSVDLVIPAYILIDKKIKRSYFFTVKIMGLKKANISVDKMQYIVIK